MVRKRLITVLTINNGVLFRTRNFTPDYRYTLNFTDAWSVDEVVLLDITRPGEGERQNFYDVVSAFAENCFVPLTVGGGVRNLQEFRHLLKLGADKVAVNTAATAGNLISEAARLYGSQCVVVSIDAKKEVQSGEYRAYAAYGKTDLQLSPQNLAAKCEALGAGEILIQSIDRDGTLEGYDNELNKLVADAVNIPVLVCGGAGNWSHFVEGFEMGGASAVCTTNIYHFTESSIKSAKIFLKNAGLDVRV